jgi:hypothetical protein
MSQEYPVDLTTELVRKAYDRCPVSDTYIPVNGFGHACVILIIIQY